jgi:DNA-binding CsgD family transcriptional regulator
MKKVKLPYASNHIKFSFSSPTYDNPQDLKYSYKLEGFDERWSIWSSSTIKEYTYLREGDYTMKLKALNNNGIQSNETILNFSISPPWYRHFLAYLVYIIIIIIAIVVIKRRIDAKIRKDRYIQTVEQRRVYLEKESKIRQEQYDLEKEIERLKREKLKIALLAKDKELVNNTIQVAKNNKTLSTIVHKLNDFNVESLDESTKRQYTKLQKSIAKELETDNNWKELEKHIKNVHFDFLKRLKEKYPTITPREMDLATFLLMNMSTKEISGIMNISLGGVDLARYRLRRRLKLDNKENLTGFLLSI